MDLPEPVPARTTCERPANAREAVFHCHPWMPAAPVKRRACLRTTVQSTSAGRRDE